jgi:para-nitrobenzyl esterase
MRVKLAWRAAAPVAALALAFAAAPAARAADGVAALEATPCSPGTTVQTVEGPVCGTTANGITAYRGIRYAAPPVGEFRFEPPQPVVPWTATFAATQEGDQCVQPGGPAPTQSEDCLNLDVQVPADARPGDRLPVMVEIHGGGFLLFGPGDGSLLVNAGHVIYVAMNYRLGILGFLAHKALGSHSGDYGLQDQQAALRWVQRNIARFGGDPHNVTIFGQSAGGASVCAQTASPTAAGLFQRGISESGEYNSLLGVDTQWQPQDCKTRLLSERQAQAAGARFAAAVGCADAKDAAACLRQVPVQTLLDAAGNGLGPDSPTIAPTVNGTTLPMSPGQAFATGRFNRDVSLMIGVARDETQLPSAQTADDYAQLVRQQYGRYATDVFDRYPLERFPSPFVAYRTIIADSDADCPAMLNDQRLSRHIPVFAYEFDDTDAPPAFFLDQTKPNGAYHVAETIAFLSGTSGLSPNQDILNTQIPAQWAGFARSGNPTVPGAPLWLPYTHHNPVVMSLLAAGDSQLTDDIPMQHQCGFWDQLTPFNHGNR